MKGIIALAALFAVAAGVALAGDRTSTTAPVMDTCTVFLTKDQIDLVKGSRGSEVTVELTEKQVKSMQSAFQEPPTWKGTSVKLSAGNLGDKGQILFWKDRVMEANPQPSPYPVPDDLRKRIEEANPQPSP